VGNQTMVGIQDGKYLLWRFHCIGKPQLGLPTNVVSDSKRGIDRADHRSQYGAGK
jgi:hypothetical protein